MSGIIALGDNDIVLLNGKFSDNKSLNITNPAQSSITLDEL